MKKALLTLAAFTILTALAGAQTNDFTYQGSLNNAGMPANGTYDFEFRLFDAENGGAQVGSTATRTGVSVVDGRFSTSLSFAGGFPGADRWLEIWVRPAGAGGYQQLLPRVKMGSSPYAVKSQSAETAATASNAATANNALNLGGVAANQYVQTTDSRLTDARTPTAGSANYIQNSTVAQPSSDFNVSGTGRVGGAMTASQFNIGANRVLATPGTGNIFAGASAGNSNSNGAANSFFGQGVGTANTTGSFNSFFGWNAGKSNIDGSNSSFFGYNAGASVTTTNFGPANSFFGALAGENTTIGNGNSFFGTAAGRANVTGVGNSLFGNGAGLILTGAENSFFGNLAGRLTTSGDANVFLGSRAGDANISGSRNVFVGYLAGLANQVGSNNTLIGTSADTSSSSLNFATAIGAEAVVSTSNSVVLGRAADTVRIPGNLNLTGAASVNGNLIVSSGNLSIFNGNVGIPTLGSAGATALCRNASNFLATCSSSLRYKTNINPFASGLDLIRRLQPITFDWKDGGLNDLGLGAEDVAAIEPLLVTYNKDGQVEGVKYDRIGVVLINAIKEQQRQIEALTRLVCESNQAAPVCLPKP